MLNFMNVKAVSERLGISEKQVRNKMGGRDSAFPVPKRISQRTVLFNEVDVEIYARGMCALTSARKIMDCMVSDLPKHASTKLIVCGVYFLENQGEIVYIGQSINVASRVNQHIGGFRPKTFDHVRVLPCEREELNNWEGFFIRLLEPRLNGRSESQPKSEIWDRVISASIT
jgi:predicted DNA-binding transcriptional regulator AlpA